MAVGHSASHWGAIEAHVEAGRLTAVKPFAKDRNPSPIIDSLAGAVYHRSGIARPMVRASYLEKGLASDRARRGAEPFVPVSWDKGTSRLGQGPSAHGCLVDVAPWHGAVPPVTAFEPPVMLGDAAPDPPV